MIDPKRSLGMKKKRNALIFFLIGVVLLSVYPLEAKKKQLSERYQKWLEEEVVYIITPLEKEVFLNLETNRERDLFIKAFWKHRDPTPATPANEFKEEHYRRINYVNHYFGRGTPKPGWKTDRGRVYIILGEPREIQRIEGKSQVYPSEIWFYQGKTKLGLPPGFNVVFYQKSFTGEYEIYSPLKDGPQALLTSYFGDPMNYMEAYRQLREYSPVLAETSLSLIPGEGNFTAGRPSLSSDLLIQKVETVPQRRIKDRYARKFMEYKDVVEVEYTANYISCQSSVKVLKDSSGMYFVHYAVEPERLSMNQYQDKYYTNLKINGKVSDEVGKNIYQFEKEVSLEFDEEQLKEVQRRPLCLKDMFPLIPGNYELSVLLKNEVSKEFTSIERNIVIPGKEDKLQMSSLILGYKTETNRPPQNRLRPFQVGEHQVYFQSNPIFLREDTLAVVFQIHGLTQELKEKARIQYDFLKGEEKFRTRSRNINEYEGLPNIVEKFSLKEFSPDHYRVRVSLFMDQKEIFHESEDFDVTYAQAIPRPWLFSKLLPSSESSVYSYLRGVQYYNQGQLEKARKNLEKAFHENPQSVGYAVNLARVYLALDEFKEVKRILSPFLEKERTEYGIYFMLGKAYQNLREWDKAIQTFDQALNHYGVNTNLLNSTGECYFRLGKMQQAREAWEKSLEINPQQPQIEKNIQDLKEKK